MAYNGVNLSVFSIQLYKIESVLRNISLNERHFLLEDGETFEVIFILYKSTEAQITY